MSKRPPYMEVIVTALVMTFLTLIVIGGINPRGESFDQVTMRTGNSNGIHRDYVRSKLAAIKPMRSTLLRVS